MGNSVKVLVKCSETVVDEVHFLVKFHTFLLFVPPLALSREPFAPGNSFAPPRQNNSENSVFFRDINQSFSAYLFFHFEPKLGKSKELNDQGMKTDRAFKSYYEGKTWFGLWKINQKIWRGLGALGCLCNFFQIWWLYSFVNRISIIKYVRKFTVSPLQLW